MLAKMKLIGAFAFVGLVLFAGISFLRDSPFTFVESTPEQQAFDNCAKQMTRKTCKIIYGADFVAVEANLSSLYIAGVGETDSSVYRELKSNGVGMCHAFRDACDKNVNSPICRLGTGLFAYGE